MGRRSCNGFGSIRIEPSNNSDQKASFQRLSFSNFVEFENGQFNNLTCWPSSFAVSKSESNRQLLICRGGETNNLEAVLNKLNELRKLRLENGVKARRSNQIWFKIIRKDNRYYPIVYALPYKINGQTCPIRPGFHNEIQKKGFEFYEPSSFQRGGHQ